MTERVGGTLFGCIYMAPFVVKDDINQTVICKLDTYVDWKANEKEIIRRANLIASAPQMLEALKAALYDLYAIDTDVDESINLVKKAIESAEKDTLNND